MVNEKLQVTEEEKRELAELQNQYYALVYEIGELTLEEKRMAERSLEIAKRKSEITDNLFDEIVNKQKELAVALSKKYGKGLVDTETGVFTPEP
jgi:hypothetical protein